MSSSPPAATKLASVIGHFVLQHRLHDSRAAAGRRRRHDPSRTRGREIGRRIALQIASKPRSPAAHELTQARGRADRHGRRTVRVGNA